MMRNGGTFGTGAAHAEPGPRGVRRLRVPAAGSALFICLLVVTYVLAGAEVAGPQPRREDLARVDGTIRQMRLGTDDRGCVNLSVRIDTERGEIRALNTALCRGLRGLDALPAGTPVTVLVQRAGGDNVVWEMTSGGRRLIAYERMRATRAAELRNHRAMWPLVALFCLPFASFIAFYLWQELQRLIRVHRP
jgi:hypothetical protein